MNLNALFHPESVVVVGVSRKPEKAGHGVFANLVQAGFPGKIWGVNSVSVKALSDSLSAEVACGKEHFETMIERFSIGAMDMDAALRVFRRVPDKAVVTGGHRTDIQLAALETDTRCLVLTGG